MKNLSINQEVKVKTPRGNFDGVIIGIRDRDFQVKWTEREGGASLIGDYSQKTLKAFAACRSWHVGTKVVF